MNDVRLGVVGYSTRALAEAATDLGFAVHAMDAFCDQDTLDCAKCETITIWPLDILQCAERVRCDGWLLAGGMEHHGRILSRLATRAPVLGPTRQQMQQLRSVRMWQQWTAGVRGLEMPKSSRDRREFAQRPHLFKPSRSSGGLHVADAHPDLDTAGLPRGYWQEFVSGRVLGVTILVTPGALSVCGATESLTAAAWPALSPYIYRGSIGPIELTSSQQESVLSLAARIGDQLRVCGTLQIDFIEDSSGHLWLLEINPRWTAGMEVLHLCSRMPGDSPLALHLRAFGIEVSSVVPPVAKLAGARYAAKAVYYAPHDLPLTRQDREWLRGLGKWQSACTNLPASAPNLRWTASDLPAIRGNEVLQLRAGEPLLTLRACTDGEASTWGQLRQELLDELHAARKMISQRLFEPGSVPDTSRSGYHA